MTAGQRLPLCALLALLLATGCAAQPSLQPFASDGCSLFPDRAFFGSADWCACCFAHDLAYWRGGTAQERLAADRKLEQCVLAATGDKLLATTMFDGVRGGGTPYLYTPFRWGYGWRFNRGYRPLSADETAMADRLEAEYRTKGDAGTCSK